MIKRLLFVIYCSLPNIAVGGSQALLGLWEAQDKAHMAIYGFIYIADDAVYWGHNKDNFPCRANYEIISKDKDDNYPGNPFPPLSRPTEYTIYKFRLDKKTCDYNKIANSDIHKRVGYIQMSIPNEDSGKARFNDFDESGTSMGWGTFQKLSAHKANDCIKGLTKVDMCEMARELSDGIASQLPMKLNSNMTWHSVGAFGSTIHAKVLLRYSSNEVSEIMENSGASMPMVKDAMQRSAENLCNEGTATEAFINLGGKFKYIYVLRDGKTLMEYEVKSCD